MGVKVGVRGGGVLEIVGPSVLALASKHIF